MPQVAPPSIPAPIAPLAPALPSAPVLPVAPTLPMPAPPQIVPPLQPNLLLLDPALGLGLPAAPAGGTSAGTGPPFNASPTPSPPSPPVSAAVAAASALLATSLAAAPAEQRHTASGKEAATQHRLSFLPIATGLGLTAPGSAAAAGAGGSAAGAAAAVAIWLIFLLPGFIGRLALPSGRRSPRSRAGEVITRPG
jgi:hypothetical protein